MFSNSSKWITDKNFEKLTPLNLLHKANAQPVQETHREDLKNRHTLFRKKFTVENKSRKIAEIKKLRYS